MEVIAAGSMMIAKDDYDAIEKQAYLYDSLYAYYKPRLVKGEIRSRNREA